jgi:hypothetical protein
VEALQELAAPILRFKEIPNATELAAVWIALSARRCPDNRCQNIGIRL